MAKLNLEQLKKFIANESLNHEKKIKKAKQSREYFDNQNDILIQPDPTNQGVKGSNAITESAGIRNADNRISHNLHQLITEQTISYGFTVPPQFDVDDEKLNERIREVFENEGYFAEVLSELALQAIHFSVAYIHYWKDAKDGSFQYAVVPGDQVIPIYREGLKKTLEGLLRYYLDITTEGDYVVVYEYWNEESVEAYYTKGTAFGSTVDSLNQYPRFGGSMSEPKYKRSHDFPGHVPFIPFYNGMSDQPNLFRYKRLIDAYDMVFSGYLNDVEDLQELILVLTNYGGTDLNQFKKELKEFKAIKIDQMDDQDKSGVQALEIQIPVEARNSILETLKEQIWEAGQGFRTTDRTAAATSGVALDQMYSSLEIKTKLMEVKFRTGLAELIKVFLEQEGDKAYNEIKVKQDWRRVRVKSMIEMANTIAVLSKNTSRENIAKNNPLVPDWQAELKMKAADDEEDMQKQLDMTFQTQQLGFNQAGNFSLGKSGSQSSSTLEPNNPSNNSKKIRKKQTGKGVGNE